MTYRFFTPGKPDKEIEFLGPLPALRALSPVPELQAATGAMLRESLLDGEITGTLLTFHFINRIVSALLAPDLPPGGEQRFPAVRSVTGRLCARAARETREPARPVAEAYASLRNAAAAGGEMLSAEARQTVVATVHWEDGRHPERPAEWATDLTRDLPGSERVGTRIALLAAFAPAAVTPGDVGLWRLSHPTDADLVRLVAYGAITATDHVAAALAPAHL